MAGVNIPGLRVRDLHERNMGCRCRRSSPKGLRYGVRATASGRRRQGDGVKGDGVKGDGVKSDGVKAGNRAGLRPCRWFCSSLRHDLSTTTAAPDVRLQG
jgi:hypothetical protein